MTDRLKLKPIKVLAKGTLDDYDKKVLVAKVQELQSDAKNNEDFIKQQIAEYEKLIKDLNLKVKVEVDRNEQLQRNLTLFVTDEYTKKQILRLYAMGNSTTYIHKILNGVKQMDVTFETISDIVTNLKNKDLEQDDLDYYAEESKKFLEQSANFEEEYRLNQIRQILENQETINEWVNKIKNEGMDEDKASQVGQLVALMKLQGENAKSLSTMMKGTNGSNFGNLVENKQLDTERFENKTVNALLNFSNAEITYEEVV